MVKPIFPTRRQSGPTGTQTNAIHDRPDLREDPPQSSFADYIEEVGISSNSPAASYDDDYGDDDGVFSAIQSQLCYLPFQSSGLSHSLRNTAPRDRIFSLPGQFGDEIPPIPRQRRKSAPVPIESSMPCSASSLHSRSNEVISEIPPTLKDIANKGQELFWFILSEELKSREAVAPGSLSALTIPPSTQRTEVLNERGRFGGRTLREIAVAFSHSSHRQRVREYAEAVHLPSLNYSSFSDLLFGLFQEGGVTQARVLVLFFFCADLALRALREKMTGLFQQLVQWTSQYITERLSSWVLDHGGWAAVLQESVDQAFKVAVLGLCILSIGVICTMLLRH